MFVTCIQIKAEVHKQSCGVTKICSFVRVFLAVNLCPKRSCASLDGINPN